MSFKNIQKDQIENVDISQVNSLQTELDGKLSTTGTAADSTKVGGITITGTPTVGQVATATSGTAATWQDASGGGGGAWTLISDQTASAVASVGVTGLTGYDEYVIEGKLYSSSGSNMHFNLSKDSLSTFITTAYSNYYRGTFGGADSSDGSTSTTDFRMSRFTTTSSSAYSVSFTIILKVSTDREYIRAYSSFGYAGDSRAYLGDIIVGGVGTDTSSIDSVRIKASGGNVTGWVKLYGIT